MLRLLLFAAIAFGVFSGTYSSPDKKKNGDEQSIAPQAHSQMPASMLLPKDEIKSTEQAPEVNDEEVAK